MQSENSYLNGAWAPVSDEVTLDNIEVIGEVPKDLNGTYYRNGPNPKFEPQGRHHVFDGDGMIHSAEFSNGKVTYRNKYIETLGLQAEDKAGKAIWPGLMDRPDRTLPEGWGSDGWLKDNSNTDLVVHNGQVLSLFYQSGDGYLMDPKTLAPRGRLDLNSMGVRSISAHSMVDEHTGELLFFDYSTKAPYMTYGVLSSTGELTHHVPIELPGPRLPHTLAFTENYTILMDLPLFWDTELLKRDIHKVVFYPELQSRFGIIKRYGAGDSISWFNADPAYIYHICTAREEGSKIILDGCRMESPAPPPEVLDKKSRLEAWTSNNARLYRWNFDLGTGDTQEEWRDDRHSEFPLVSGQHLGYDARYSYNALIDQHSKTLRFSGIAKYNLDSTAADTYDFGHGKFGSESPFAARDNSKAEDDGYVVSFVGDENSDCGEIQIFDAANISDGPVGRVLLPVRVPPGFHAFWAPEGYV